VLLWVGRCLLLCSFGVHNVRVEDFPVMPVEVTSGVERWADMKVLVLPGNSSATVARVQFAAKG
jgi:hypothetical protein